MPLPQQRAFDPNRDRAEVLALADASPLSLPHRADWPYRLASWALDDPANMQIWHDESGTLLGWAALQTPFWAVDCATHPDAPIALYTAIMQWSITRMQELAAVGAGRPLWFVSIADTCVEQRRILETMGFTDVSNTAVDPWSKVLFALDDTPMDSEVALPNDLNIRSLRAPEEIPAYVALHREVFESENMTIDWRRRSIQQPDYRNALDLVLVDDAGKLCGFCVAWLRQCRNGDVVGQIEPLGVQRQYRGRKFSRALLGEAVSRLRSMGARRVYVETDRQRESAMAAYAAIGFQVAHEICMYRYDVPVRVPNAI